MYTIVKQQHPKYGDVLLISLVEFGEYKYPSQVVSKVKILKSKLLAGDIFKIKILLNNQILSIKELEKWSIEEYNSLSKCFVCGDILNENVFTHRFCGKNLFCSQKCADSDYMFEMDKLNDEEDIDF